MSEQKMPDLPEAQVRTIGACILALKEIGKKPVWHLNECGCCVSVHDDVEHVTGGYLIGKDGGYEWLALDHSHNGRGNE